MTEGTMAISVNLSWRAHAALLFLLFMTCFSLGYNSLRWTPELEKGNDARWYHRMADNNPDVNPPFRYRILTPALVRGLMPVVAKVPHGSFNVTSLAFLAVNSVFLALAAYGLFHVAFLLLRDRLTAVLAALLFVTSFTSANQYLVGMVDAAETFFLAMVVWCSLRGWWWAVPLLFGIAALGKETTIIQGTTWLVGYAACGCLQTRKLERRIVLSTCASILTGLGVIWAVHVAVGGPEYAPHRLSLDQFLQIPATMINGVFSRCNVYAFALLLPLGLPRLRKVPSPYRSVSLMMGFVALLAASYAQIGATNFGRPIFTALGPLLSISSAIYLKELFAPPTENGAGR